MSYTALAQMRARNEALFGPGVGPLPPEKHYDPADRSLKASALRFLHERCEGLRFDEEQTAAEAASGAYRGSSLLPGQIPYAMQMDLDRLCLERELERFIDSGAAEDAYNVYYCYLEMFFGRYGKSKRMVELLSEFESNGSSLLMKHRDHYSHSVYVFALGLALYDSSSAYRAAFRRFYGFGSHSEADRAAACRFLEFWGLTSLFHDIGYPFELPFEQVMSYFEVAGQERGRGSLFLAYRGVDALIALGDGARARFETLYGRRFSNAEELLAASVTAKLGEAYGFTEESILRTIRDKPGRPDSFGYYMDHAYFSAARLYRELESALGAEKLTEMHVDALTAILLHNSLFKFAVSFYKDEEKRKAPLPMDLHPLAWLLMLCDELQCWDRTAYGRNSRTELHPMAADFDFTGGSIRAVYHFDREEQEKIDAYRLRYREWEAGGRQGKAPRLKAYSDMAEKERRFLTDIERIVDTDPVPLAAAVDTRQAERKSKHAYLSQSSFLHLFDFAVALNARYAYEGREKDVDGARLEAEFEALSLEYQLSNLNQAKGFARYLDALDCFYTDRPVDYDLIPAFTEKQTAIFAPMEHERWVREHISMAWQKGDLYETAPLPPALLRQYGDEPAARKALREQLRMHKLTMEGDPAEAEIFAHYAALSEADQGKDYKPFNSMLKLVRKFDGLRIYSLN